MDHQMLHYHLLGIGGTGMSAIAHLLLDQGHHLSGCDPQPNALTAELAERGASIYRGHDPAHLVDVDLVVTSSALAVDHPELLAAHHRKLPVLKRSDLWRTWSLEKPTLAVAGTHGKTTTTAMCTMILAHLACDPAYIVPAGGPVPGLDRFARWGTGPFVVEADEYDRLFLGLLPRVAIITSVDWDHVDIYPSRADTEATFATFAAQTTSAVVCCLDDPGAARLYHAARAASGAPRMLGYGLRQAPGWWAGAIESSGDTTSFLIHPPADAGSPAPVPALINVPGHHNVQNALAAVVAVYELLDRTVPVAAIVAGLAHYRGAARRFEWKGESGGVIVVDDYAHNPAKVRAAIAAARIRFPDRRLVVYIQPHTYSRTVSLVAEWSTAFDGADLVALGDIYPSREQASDFPGITAAWLGAHIATPPVVLVGDVAAASLAVAELVCPGDLLLTLGAGNGYRVGEHLLEHVDARP
ncbi:MAG: UDP-N-acetylmuramate--L-alanine ligase [Herpetosiphon sp.]